MHAGNAAGHDRGGRGCVDTFAIAAANATIKNGVHRTARRIRESRMSFVPDPVQLSWMFLLLWTIAISGAMPVQPKAPDVCKAFVKADVAQVLGADATDGQTFDPRDLFVEREGGQPVDLAGELRPG